MKEGETLRAHSDHYWELYNKIKEDNGGIAASTFKVGLPVDSDLRASLALKPITNMNKLMELVEKYKRLEDDQLQEKAKVKAPMEDKKEVKMDKTLRPWRDFFAQAKKQRTKMVSSFYKELVYRIVEKIKSESYFRWLNKMSGDVTRKNQNLCCSYHRDRGHSTEDCRILRDHLR